MGTKDIFSIFAENLEVDEGRERVKELSGDWIMERLLEESYVDKIFPPQRVGSSRKTNHDALVKMVDIEPTSPPMTITFGKEEYMGTFKAPRAEIPFYTISRERFEKSQHELLSYEMPIERIIEDGYRDLFGYAERVSDIKGMNVDCFGNEDQIGWTCHETVGIGIANTRALKRLSLYTEDFMRGQKFKVRKDKLIEAIKKNREAHNGEYVEAVVGYQEAVVKALRKKAKAVVNVVLFGDTGILNDPGHDMQHWARADMPDSPPQCHLDDYDQALRMLDVIEDEVIEMDASEIDRYMYDRWGWKEAHTQALNAYSISKGRG